MTGEGGFTVVGSRSQLQQLFRPNWGRLGSRGPTSSMYPSHIHPPILQVASLSKPPSDTFGHTRILWKGSRISNRNGVSLLSQRHSITLVTEVVRLAFVGESHG